MHMFYARGELAMQQGNYANGVKMFFKSLKLARAVKDRQFEGRVLDQIGVVYWFEGELNKGLGYFLEAYAIAEEVGDFNSMSGIMNNMGIIYRRKGEYEKAEKYYLRSAELCRKLNKKDGLGDVLNNIGVSHQENADYEKAIEYYKESLKIREEIDDKIGISTTLGNMGSLYLKDHQPEEAKKYLFRALEISEAIDDLEGIKDICSNLSELFLAAGDGVKALDYYKKYTEADKKLVNAHAEKEIYQQELASNYEKEKLTNQKEQEKRNIQAEAVRKKQKITIYASLSVLGVVIVFSLFLFNRFRITKRQKKLIEFQKKEVEAKNHEIIDSINYAKRLQDAILPPEKLYKEIFSESFIIYRPKDIVAGDFYFLETVGDLQFFGVADCTGHGVPGALVSVVCSNALHRAIKEFNITDPGLVLDKVRELVLKTFEKSVSEVKDGMDISLCAYNTKTKKLHWSGANNAIWIYTIKAEGSGIVEIKPTKQAIGYDEKPMKFLSHEIQLKAGDTLYLFSDGFPDQFGGPEGRKFMYKTFQRKIESLAHLNMADQKVALTNAFDDWINRNGAGVGVKKMEQTDDVCVLGIRI